VGLRAGQEQGVQINPLLPDSAWDWFCLDNVLYHGHRLAIVWDRTGERYNLPRGLTILSDGKLIAHRPTLGSLSSAGY
jgi:hypothetical protein